MDDDEFEELEFEEVAQLEEETEKASMAVLRK